jgi:hypothetical protein
MRQVVSALSTLSEPVRSRVRGKALARAATLQLDQTVSDSPPVLVLMVYRARNTQLVQIFLRQVDPNADVRLWALDEIAPELASQTLGCGPGVRFSHLNSLYNAKPIAQGSWVVLTDDDVFFHKGSLTKTIDLMKQGGFSLAQPGQSILGWWTDLFSIARPLVRARDTNCVEQGPLVIADPAFAEKILPFPKVNDMGWGIEAEWYRTKEGRFRIGIIDDCRVVHWGRVANSYPAGPEMKRMHERLAISGIDSIWQLRSANEYWWKWQHIPSWKKI